MFDNGLFEKFEHTKTRDGILDLGNTKDFSYSHLERGVWKMIGGEGLYYAKSVNKSRMDAELLLSQVCKGLGFSTAIYHPFQNLMFDAPNLTETDIINLQNYRYAVSNNVVFDHTPLAYEHYSNLTDGNRQFCSLPYSLFKDKSGVDYTKYFTKDAMRQLIKMNLFDIASFNFDRHENNYALKIEDGIVVDIVLFDYGASGVGAKRMNEDERYFTSFQEGFSNKENSLKAFKENPVIEQFVPFTELANEIGNVDFVETSRDIKEELGYKVNFQYIDKLTQSFDETAEFLMK